MDLRRGRRGWQGGFDEACRLPEDSAIPDARQRVKLLQAILHEGRALHENTRLGTVLVDQGVVRQHVVDEAHATGSGWIGETLQRGCGGWLEGAFDVRSRA